MSYIKYLSLWLWIARYIIKKALFSRSSLSGERGRLVHKQLLDVMVSAIEGLECADVRAFCLLWGCVALGFDMQTHRLSKLGSQHPDPGRGLTSLPHTTPHRRGGRQSQGTCWVLVEQAHTAPRRLTPLSRHLSFLSQRPSSSNCPAAYLGLPSPSGSPNPRDRKQWAAPRRTDKHRRPWKLDLKVKFKRKCREWQAWGWNSGFRCVWESVVADEAR